MTAVILINVVLNVLVVVGIVGSLAYSVAGHSPLRTIRRRMDRNALSGSLARPGARQSITRA